MQTKMIRICLDFLFENNYHSHNMQSNRQTEIINTTGS